MRTAPFIVFILGLNASFVLLAQPGNPTAADTIGLSVSPKSAIGSRSLAVLLLQFEGDAAPAYDRELIQKLFVEANEFYKEASYGQFAFTWDIVGPLAVSTTAPCGSEQRDAATTAARAVAEQAGVDLAKYDTVVLAGSGCIAEAMVDGSHVWLLEPGLGARTVAHELGHSLGIYHADYLYCPSAPFVPLLRAFAPECQRLEGRDHYDVMGWQGGFHHFSAVFKEFFGWLTPVEVTQSGIYRIEPFELPESSVKAIKIPAGNGNFFYLEYRRPIGFDRVTSSAPQFVGMFQGALVRLGQVTSINSFPSLLAMDGLTDLFPGFPSDPLLAPLRRRPALTPGVMYVEPGNRFSIKTLSMTPEAIEVEVTILDSEPEPRFSFGQPLDGMAVSGNVKVALVAAEPDTISRIELARDGELLESRTAGGSQTFHFDWDTALELPGKHRLTATAYGKDGTISMRSVDVAVHRLPTVLFSVQNQSIALGEQVRLIASVTVDEQTTVKAVEVVIEGPTQSQRLTGTAQSSGTYLLNWTPSERGTFTLWAEVEDSAGFRNWSWGMTATVTDMAIASQGVVNAASFRSSVSPGSLISIFGGGFATNTVSASSVPLPWELGGVTVTIGGFRAPLLFVSSTQINAQVPWAVESACSNGRVRVIVSGANGTVEADVSCQLQAPAIFRSGGPRQAVATHADGSLVGPESPAKAGETITLWGTGLGPVTPPARDGEAMDDLQTAKVTPVVTIGGVAAEVSFAGLAPGLVGVNQLNVVVPADVEPGDVVPLFVLVGSIGDRDSFIAVSP